MEQKLDKIRKFLRKLVRKYLVPFTILACGMFVAYKILLIFILE